MLSDQIDQIIWKWLHSRSMIDEILPIDMRKMKDINELHTQMCNIVQDIMFIINKMQIKINHRFDFRRKIYMWSLYLRRFLGFIVAYHMVHIKLGTYWANLCIIKWIIEWDSNISYEGLINYFILNKNGHTKDDLPGLFWLYPLIKSQKQVVEHV